MSHIQNKNSPKPTKRSFSSLSALLDVSKVIRHRTQKKKLFFSSCCDVARKKDREKCKRRRKKCVSNCQRCARFYFAKKSESYTIARRYHCELMKHQQKCREEGKKLREAINSRFNFYRNALPHTHIATRVNRKRRLASAHVVEKKSFFFHVFEAQKECFSTLIDVNLSGQQTNENFQLLDTLMQICSRQLMRLHNTWNYQTIIDRPKARKWHCALTWIIGWNTSGCLEIQLILALCNILSSLITI